MSIRFQILALTALLVAAPVVRSAEPELTAELGSRQIYEGESVAYTVFLNHVDQPVELQLEGSDQFDLQFRGRSREDREERYNINGRRTVIVRHGFKYHYTLTPRATGTLQIPAPVAEVSGQQIVGNACQLSVRGVEPQDVVVMELRADPPTVYMMQPFTVSLNIAVKAIEGGLRDTNPMVGLRREPPQLQIPWADDQQLPSGLKPKAPADRWLRALRAPSGDGFAINDAREAASIFDFGFDMRGRAASFLSTARRTKRADLQGNQVEYWEYSFQREFTATDVGEFSFGPVSLKGTFAKRSTGLGRVSGEEVVSVAKSITLEVKDAPLEGRPETYVGAVGQFEIEGQLTPTEVQVGDPMTLTLSLRGRGTIDRIVAPDLSLRPEIEQSFKIYDSTAEAFRGGKRFTYSLRPRTSDIAEFPSIPVSYFDVQKEQYVTVSTDAVPIQVAAAERLAADQIARSTPGQRPNVSIESREEGIFANVTQPSAFADESIHPVRWVAGAGGLVGVYALTALLVTRVQRNASDRPRMRRRRTASRARKRLAAADKEIQSGERQAAADDLRAVFIGLIADVADLPEAGLTPVDAQRQLEEFQLPPELIAKCTDLLHECDNARYGAGGDLSGMERDAESLLDGLLAACRKRKLLS